MANVATPRYLNRHVDFSMVVFLARWPKLPPPRYPFRLVMFLMVLFLVGFLMVSLLLAATCDPKDP